RGASVDAEEVHDEDQGLARLDARAGAGVAVAEVRRDDELAAAADLHAGHALVPARDDAAGAERELEGGAAVPRGVELLAGGEGDADVVDADLVARLGLGAVAEHEVLDLQVGGRVAAREVDLRLRECHEVLLLTMAMNPTTLRAPALRSVPMTPAAPDSIMLTGRVAVVAGAARGVGLAIAEALVAFGAHVAACDRVR